MDAADVSVTESV